MRYRDISGQVPKSSPTFASIMNRSDGSSKPVAIWIGIGVAMLLIQIILGGVTRLTGSGLSITEWNIITGVIPPLHEQDWLAEFAKYKQTPQFQLLNVDFTLSDFKFIFFWEWLHRFWARLIGVVFIVGFVYLVSRRSLKQSMVNPLLILFLLGAMQGAVGWIMVASGLTGDAVYVKPTRLALHFIFAIVLIAYAWWFFLQLTVERNQLIRSRGIRNFTGWITALVVIQLLFGALMAGHKAATAAPTWPDINGAMIPGHMFDDTRLLMNFIENKITVHFMHRMLAYLILLLVLVLSFRMYRHPAVTSVFRKIRPLPVLLVVVQVLLGVLAVLVSPRIIPNHWGAFEWFAQLHQVGGMLLALSLVSLLYVVRRR